MSDDLDVKGLFSRMLQTPDDNLTLDREQMLGTAHRAMRRRRGVRIGVASAAALGVLGAAGTATASALHEHTRTQVNVGKNLPAVLPPSVAVPQLPSALPKLPVPGIGTPQLPLPDQPLPLPKTSLPGTSALPKLPIELNVGPQLDKAKQMLADLSGALLAGKLPLPDGLPSLPALPGLPQLPLPNLPGLPNLPSLPTAGAAAPTVSSAQAFQYADGTFRYHVVSAGSLAGFGGTVTLDVVARKQQVPTAADLCLTKLVKQETGCEVVMGGAQPVRLGWHTVNGAQSFFATAFYPAGTVTLELSPSGLTLAQLPAPALAALAALAAFQP